MWSVPYGLVMVRRCTNAVCAVQPRRYSWFLSKDGTENHGHNAATAVVVEL